MAGQKTARRDQQIHPWDKQERETAAAYAAFRAYLNLGAGRSLKAAYSAEYQKRTKRVPKSAPSGRWRAWSSAYAWPRRAAAWDAHKSKQVRDGMADALRDEVGARSGRETIEEYRGSLERLKGVANTIIGALEDRLREAKGLAYLGLKDDATTAKYAADVLGRANRDLLLILGGPALEANDEDDDPGSRETPAPISLRPKAPPETES